MGVNVSLIYGDIVTQIGTTDLGIVSLDINESEMFTRAKKVTRHPIESGATISDHIQDEPDTLEITGFISQTVISLDDWISEPVTRAEDGYNKLLELMDTKKPISIVTPKATYENMAIERISRPRDATIGQGAKFTISMIQIVTVESEIGEFDVGTAQKRQSRSPKKKIGKKQKTEANVSQVQKKSIAASGWDALTASIFGP